LVLKISNTFMFTGSVRVAPVRQSLRQTPTGSRITKTPIEVVFHPQDIGVVEIARSTSRV
ncbi:MAG: hypothetical protein V8R75_02595, partial [Oscillospiraceae bacterium]